ncbi:MAG: 5-formyltetrahydrofolate cyclo-ligase [Cardiobacteriaceae bacterium]|nr:5-formyltetrahydrofolate cyclo-ligase [Cardiobacteriaceae bacterium]
MSLSPQQQRQQARQARRAIIGERREQYSQQAATHLAQSAFMQHAEHIAVFLSLPEEINTKPLIEMLWQQGKALYLPYVIAKDCPLLWLPYTAQTLLVPDNLGILAPLYDSKALCAPTHQLDVVVMPLVAWDLKGSRLGMGGGYYDRTLAEQSALLRVGFSYQCQMQTHIVREDWDLPLHHLATEQQCYSF